MSNGQLPTRLRQDWKFLVFFGAGVYVLNVVLRMTALSAWHGFPLAFDGEYIQSTPDAYLWLAQAKGFGAAENPLAYLARFLSWASGAKLGNVGFWAPVFISSLAAVLTLLWCWALGCLEAGILAGAVAGLAPGFVGRTHLGFYDTDMVTLLFPLCISLGWYLWLKPNLFPRWPLPAWLAKRLPQSLQSAESKDPILSVRYLTWTYVLGLCAHFFGLWHERIANFNDFIIFPVLFLGLITARKGARPLLLVGVALYALSTHPGWQGILAGAVLLAALYCVAWLRRKLFSSMCWSFILLAAALVFVSLGNQPSLFWVIRFYLQRYLQPIAPAWAAGQTSLVFPSVSSGVAEASKVGWAYLEFFSLWGWTALCAVPGFLLVLLRYPGAFLLLPLAALGMSGYFLGVRMAMFGAPAYGIGLGIPLYWLVAWLVRKLKWRRLLLALGETLCAAVLIWPCFAAYSMLPPKAVFSPYFCQALDLLQHVSPENAIVWTRWEWGYGVNYYAFRNSFADGGGRRTSAIIYVLNQVFYTDNPVLLHNLLAHYSDYVTSGTLYERFDRMTSRELHELMRTLRTPDANVRFKSPQYVVASFKMLQYLENIAQAATWDFETKRGQNIALRYFLGNVRFKAKQGIVSLGPGTPDLHVDSLDVFLPTGVRKYKYTNNSGLHVLVNPITKESYLLHTRAYESMAVQLLVADPKDEHINRYFELVYDKTPWVRMYRAR